MGVAKNAMEVFGLLNKSNCRECGEKTCLAFASKVYLGSRVISDCPHLSQSTYKKFRSTRSISISDEEYEKYIQSLAEKVAELDFQRAATRIKGTVANGALNIQILGKNFSITKDGAFITDLHIIPWVIQPALEYFLNCAGLVPGGEWISFRETKGGREKYGLFKKRGEESLKELADKYPDFFQQIVFMFNGKKVPREFASDVSVVLYPFPLVPLMICYWKPDEGLNSTLNLFFDASVEQNIGADAAFFIGTGFAQMLVKLSEVHGF